MKAYWRIVPAMAAILVAAGCHRVPAGAKDTPAEETESFTMDLPGDPWHDPKQIEMFRRMGRDRLGDHVCAQLDQRYQYWALHSHKKVLGVSFLTLKTSPDASETWSLAGVSRDGQVFMTKDVTSPATFKLNGLYDVDGDGHKEAAFWIWSGGMGGYDTCLFVKLHPEPYALGGNNLCPGDCGEPVDLDHDGRIEFKKLDEAFEGTWKIGPLLPYIYGFRDDRFVELTPTLGRSMLLRELREAKGVLRGTFARPEDKQRGRYAECIRWYVCAMLLGKEETAVIAELRRTLSGEEWRYFEYDLEEFREVLLYRSRRLFVGTGDYEPEVDL